MTPERTPPWQMTRTSRQGFGLSVLFTVVTVLNWLLAADDGTWFSIVAAAVFSVLTVALVASSVALRRRERS